MIGPWFFAVLLATNTGEGWVFARNHVHLTVEGCRVALAAQDAQLRASVMTAFAALEPTVLGTECLTEVEVDERNGVL